MIYLYAQVSDYLAGRLHFLQEPKTHEFLNSVAEISMNRRLLLKLLAAAAVSGCGQRQSTTKNLNVVVVGAGIVGASIAYHLAKAGTTVTVIDKLGPATHASRGTFAWINATWAKQPRHYHTLSQDGLANWRDLQPLLDLPVKWGGSLEWFDNAEREKKLVAQISEQVEWGEPARMVNAAQFAGLEPNILFDAGNNAAYSPNDGAVDPVVATHKLLTAAEDLGATIVFPSDLKDIVMTGGRLSAVETSTGTSPADRLVLATGAATDPPRTIGGVDIPQRSTPGVIAITAPMPPLLNRVISAPGIHMHQRNDGRIVLGEQDGAPQNEAHAMRLEGRPNDFPARDFAEQHAERMLTVAKTFLPGIAGAVIDNAYIGWRPLPIDGHPILGASPVRPDVYFSIMHSGVSLAPIVGQLASFELTEGVAIERLDQYRPGRVFEDVKRY